VVLRHSKLSRSAVVASVEPPVPYFHARSARAIAASRLRSPCEILLARRAGMVLCGYAPSPMSSAFACLHTCHLANKEIRLADSPLFGGSVRIIRRGQHLSGRHLAKIKTDDRSRPLGSAGCCARPRCQAKWIDQDRPRLGTAAPHKSW